MYKDIPRSDLLKSPLSKKFLKFYNHGQSFISYKSNFILDGLLFFPIDENTFTCSDLFCHFEKVNYKKFFTEDFYKMHSNFDALETIENAFIIGSSQNYYHSIIDFFPRVFSYKKSIFKNIDKLIIGNDRLKPIFEYLLQELKIELEIKIIKNKVYFFKNSVFTINNNFEKINNLYRNTFYDNNLKANRKIFISRKDATSRTIINENELINFLKNNDFEIINLSKKKFIDQVKIFNSSKLIVAMHGAGLTNLLFCKNNTKVIEITENFIRNLDIQDPIYMKLKDKKNIDWFTKKNSSDYNLYTRSMYNYFSKQNNLEHFFYFAKGEKPNGVFKHNYQEFTYTSLRVDIKKLSNFIKQIEL